MKFKASKEEYGLIGQIMTRLEGLGHVVDRINLSMDLDACHSNGCPLDFQKLLDFPDGDFSHDVFGINNHMDRGTGKLTDCFLPRCAL